MYRLLFLVLLLTSCSKSMVVNKSFDQKKYKFPKRSENYVSLSRVQTGHNLSAESLVMDQGRNNINHYSIHQAFLIEKNNHRILIDTGMSKDGKAQLREIPQPFRSLLDYTEDGDVNSKYPRDLEAIFITHMHFDHVSAIKDLAENKKTKIFISNEEFESAMAEKPPFGYIPLQYDSKDLKWEKIKFTEKTYGPFPRYFDYLGDGTIIIVELPGHTKGSIGILVNTQETRVFLVGDAVWSIEEVISQKSKSKLASYLVDEDKEQTLKTIKLLHNIWMANADTRIVPAHDLKASIFINSIDNAKEVH
ncbi:MBL fold metallo-hydrolase [Bacteriovorax sp. Seq25_V]|uniref:MBL fold metallo-hydrolase n=1 Tax=Bacteriovorax sp. Seq25_V TaxID=1201288 RepID=UPI00038A3A39|nr:MBL fold metallo-hydrolase [Bacteriovorax sp. Seq25_V]EQC43855.1 metallo-beta-lactamase domain protein [Bacteriovorax sp. Seq25_V]